MIIQPIYVAKQEKRLKRYIRYPRPLLYLFIDGHLNSSEYCFYHYLVCYAGFDQRNIHFEHVDLKVVELASLFGKSENIVRKWLTKLIKCKLIIKTPDGYFKINHYDALFVQTKDTFSSDIPDKDLLNKLFDLKCKNFSDKTQKNVIKTKINVNNTSNNPQNRDVSRLYNVSSRKVSKISNGINRVYPSYDKAQGIWLDEYLSDEEIEEISKHIN